MTLDQVLAVIDPLSLPVIRVVKEKTFGNLFEATIITDTTPETNVDDYINMLNKYRDHEVCNITRAVKNNISGICICLK